jgi:DNA topoisomerase-1
MIRAGIGRYGPYVQHNRAYANLPGADEVFDIGLNRAVAVLAEKLSGAAGKHPAPATLRELGAHPVSGQPIRVLSGRYGPYVKHGQVNANLPKGVDPQALTLEEALALIAAREANPSSRPKGRRRASGAQRPSPA